MRNSKTLSPNQIQAVKRLQKFIDPEIRTYISSLQRDYAKYRQPLKAARKIIDEAMKTVSLTDVLHESREQ
jgi:hypothetical protein